MSCRYVLRVEEFIDDIQISHAYITRNRRRIQSILDPVLPGETFDNAFEAWFAAGAVYNELRNQRKNVFVIPAPLPERHGIIKRETRTYMSDKTMEDIKSGKGLPPLSNNSSL